MQGGEMPETERIPLLRAPGTVPLPSPGPGRVGGVLSLLNSKVEDHPHETALSVYENGFWRRVSYAEIRHHAERLSEYLMERGCGANERAAILAESKPEWGMAFFAIVRVCVPEERPGVLRALTLQAYEELRGKGYSFFTIGLDIRDPLSAGLKGLLAQPTDVSALITSPSGRYEGPALDDFPLHHEIALV